MKYVFTNVSLTSQKTNGPQITVRVSIEQLCRAAFFPEPCALRCGGAAAPGSAHLPSDRPLFPTSHRPLGPIPAAPMSQVKRQPAEIRPLAEGHTGDELGWDLNSDLSDPNPSS